MEILVLLVLILLNGFFALSEIALVSSKQARIEQMAADGSRGAKATLKLRANSERFLSAIQVGITLIGNITGLYGGMNLADDVAPMFATISFLAPYAHEIALVVTVVLITYVSIVIGELVPKTMALSNPEKVAVVVAPIISYFSTAFYPFVKILAVSTTFVNRLIGLKPQSEQITESELRQMIKTATYEGVLEDEQRNIHEKVFYFADKKAKHIMTHRIDVDWIDVLASSEKNRELLLASKKNVVVCCKGNLDEVVGTLWVPDYLRAMVEGKRPNLQKMIARPTYVHENMYAQKVLDLIRNNETHVCCVVNEYGGFEGIITLYDVMESIVGHITTEEDAAEPDVFVRDDKTILVNADAPIEVLGDIIPNFTIDFEKIDYATIAGFVIEKMNKIPKVGDKLEYDDFVFEVVDKDGYKLDKILIYKSKESAESEA